MIHKTDGDPGLSLRALTVEDADAYYALLDRNRDHLSQLGGYEQEKSATPEWVHDHLATDPAGSLRYGIFLNDELIGRVDLIAVDPPRYRTSYWLDKDHLGAGHASAAAAALFDYAAKELGATDVYARVTHGNDKALAVLRRLDFAPVTECEGYTRYHKSLG